MRWRVDVGLAVALAALTAALAAGLFLDYDVAVRDWVDAHRPHPAYVAARVFLLLGQGYVLVSAGVLATAFCVFRWRSVRPVLPFAAAYLGLYVVIGAFKVATDRASPHLPADVAHRERFFSGGLEYPSGHVANTFVWYGLLVLLLGSWLPAWLRTVLRVVPPVVVGVMTTYLAFHWVTDTVAGVFAGMLLDRALRRIDWNRIPLGTRDWARPVQELR